MSQSCESWRCISLLSHTQPAQSFFSTCMQYAAQSRLVGILCLFACSPAAPSQKASPACQSDGAWKTAMRAGLGQSSWTRNSCNRIPQQNLPRAEWRRQHVMHTACRRTLGTIASVDEWGSASNTLAQRQASSARRSAGRNAFWYPSAGDTSLQAQWLPIGAQAAEASTMTAYRCTGGCTVPETQCGLDAPACCNTSKTLCVAQILRLHAYTRGLDTPACCNTSSLVCRPDTKVAQLRTPRYRGGACTPTLCIDLKHKQHRV